MLEEGSVRSADPEGERFLGALPWPVDTPGGRFFAQFLHAGGRWERFVSNTPLDYVGNRGSAVVDVLGTVTLSILCGHWRYAHINSVRGDRLNPPLLNMSGTVSEDVVQGDEPHRGERWDGMAQRRVASMRRAGIESAMDPGYRRDDQADLWAATRSRAGT